jgi:hypothetical protein
MPGAPKRLRDNAHRVARVAQRPTCATDDKAAPQPPRRIARGTSRRRARSQRFPGRGSGGQGRPPRVAAFTARDKPAPSPATLDARAPRLSQPGPRPPASRSDNSSSVTPRDAASAGVTGRPTIQDRASGPRTGRLAARACAGRRGGRRGRARRLDRQPGGPLAERGWCC